METVDLITVIQSMEWSDPAYSWLDRSLFSTIKGKKTKSLQ